MVERHVRTSKISNVCKYFVDRVNAVPKLRDRVFQGYRGIESVSDIPSEAARNNIWVVFRIVSGGETGSTWNSTQNVVDLEYQVYVKHTPDQNEINGIAVPHYQALWDYDLAVLDSLRYAYDNPDSPKPTTPEEVAEAKSHSRLVADGEPTFLAFFEDLPAYASARTVRLKL